MGYKSSLKAAQTEIRMQEAIQTIKDDPSITVYKAAQRFEVSRHTLGRRIASGKSHIKASEDMQILSNAEEKTLVKWIMRYTRAGSPITPTLLKELVDLIQQKRIQRVFGNEASVLTTTPIGHKWLYRFLKWHLTI
jgi:hypothetical protein